MGELVGSLGLGEHLLGVFQLRRRGLANRQLQLPLPHAERHPVVPRELLVLLANGLGALVGHQAHLLVGLPFRAGNREVDVVDVAAGAVAHGGHEGRILPIGAEQLLDAVGENGEIVGRDVIGTGPADVVQRVIGQQAQRPALERLQGEEGDLRIDGPGRLEQVRAVARVHLGLVRLAEGIEQLGARLHQPAPAEHLPRQVRPCPRRSVPAADC